MQKYFKAGNEVVVPRANATQSVTDVRVMDVPAVFIMYARRSSSSRWRGARSSAPASTPLVTHGRHVRYRYETPTVHTRDACGSVERPCRHNMAKFSCAGKVSDMCVWQNSFRCMHVAQCPRSRQLTCQHKHVVDADADEDEGQHVRHWR